MSLEDVCIYPWWKDCFAHRAGKNWIPAFCGNAPRLPCEESLTTAWKERLLRMVKVS